MASSIWQVILRRNNGSCYYYLLEYVHLYTLLIFLLFSFSTQMPLIREMIAGGSAGACQIVITTPMELLKIQMQDAGRVAAAAKLGLYSLLPVH